MPHREEQVDEVDVRDVMDRELLVEVRISMFEIVVRLPPDFDELFALVGGKEVLPVVCENLPCFLATSQSKRSADWTSTLMANGSSIAISIRAQACSK